MGGAVTDAKRRTLVMDVRVGESISLDGGRIVITVSEKSGQRAKLRLSVPDGAVVDHGAGSDILASSVVARRGTSWSRGS